MTQPRGIRNHNPGNIRWGADWQGLKRAESYKIRPFVYLSIHLSELGFSQSFDKLQKASQPENRSQHNQPLCSAE